MLGGYPDPFEESREREKKRDIWMGKREGKEDAQSTLVTMKKY